MSLEAVCKFYLHSFDFRAMKLVFTHRCKIEMKYNMYYNIVDEFYEL